MRIGGTSLCVYCVHDLSERLNVVPTTSPLILCIPLQSNIRPAEVCCPHTIDFFAVHVIVADLGFYHLCSQKKLFRD